MPVGYSDHHRLPPLPAAHHCKTWFKIATSFPPFPPLSSGRQGGVPHDISNSSRDVFTQGNPLLGDTSVASVLSPYLQGWRRQTLGHHWTVLSVTEHPPQFILVATFSERSMTFALNNTAISSRFGRKLTLNRNAI